GEDISRVTSSNRASSSSRRSKRSMPRLWLAARRPHPKTAPASARSTSALALLLVVVGGGRRQLRETHGVVRVPDAVPGGSIVFHGRRAGVVRALLFIRAVVLDHGLEVVGDAEEPLAHRAELLHQVLAADG